MNKLNSVVTLQQIQSGVKFYKCKFYGSAKNTYTYKSCLDLEAGDSVIVETQGREPGYKVVEVMSEVDGGDVPIGTDVSFTHYVWIVDKVDEEQYHTNVRAERSVINKLKLKNAEVQYAADVEHISESKWGI